MSPTGLEHRMIKWVYGFIALFSHESGSWKIRSPYNGDKCNIANPRAFEQFLVTMQQDTKVLNVTDFNLVQMMIADRY